MSRPGRAFVGLVMLCGVAAMAGCTSTQATSTPRPTASAQKELQPISIHPGLGSFTFSDAIAVHDHPIQIFYIAPKDDLADADVLVVMPGDQRNAEDYRADWEGLVAHRNVLVLVPQLPDDDYDDDAYNLGNLVDSDGDPRPSQEWTYSAIQSLFDDVVGTNEMKADDFMMFGHSAGAQFVHRFVEYMPSSTVSRVVTANAGWYTVPDDEIDFPYGLHDGPTSAVETGSAFSTDMTILLGADDIDSDDSSLRHDEGSDEQGETRLERGLNYFLAARLIAADQGVPFDWRLRVVPGVAHDHTAMAREAAKILLA